MDDTPIVAYHPVAGLLVYNEEWQAWLHTDGSLYASHRGMPWSVPWGAKLMVKLPTHAQISYALSGRTAVLDPDGAADAVLTVLKEGQPDAEV